MNKKYKIAIVDDHDILRDGLKFTLSQINFAEIIGEARNGIEFLELMKTISPDVVLMDIAMPEMDGIEATKEILKTMPDLKIIALTMFDNEEYYFKMVTAGAVGFVLKKSSIDELEKAIITVADGDNYFSNELLRKIIFNIGSSKIKNIISDTKIKITKRELEVLKEICNGLTAKEIGEKLHISSKTVEGHRNNLLAKTNSKNTISMVIYAIKNKLINI